MMLSSPTKLMALAITSKAQCGPLLEHEPNVNDALEHQHYASTYQLLTFRWHCKPKLALAVGEHQGVRASDEARAQARTMF